MKISNLILMAMLTVVVGLSGEIANADNQINRNELIPPTVNDTELGTRVTALVDGGAEVGNFTAGGLLTSLGLQTGDIVLSVNGILIDPGTSLADAVCMAAHTPDQTIINILLKRAGKELSLYCTIME